MFLNLLLPNETSISLYDTIIWGILNHPCLWFSGLKYCITQNINAKKKLLHCDHQQNMCHLNLKFKQKIWYANKSISVRDFINKFAILKVQFKIAFNHNIIICSKDTKAQCIYNVVDTNSLSWMICLCFTMNVCRLV